MKMNHFSIVLLITISLLSCKKEEPAPPPPDPSPVACFTSDKEFQVPFQPVNFSNCSKDYERAEWNFGNGGAATISDPSTTYIKAGVYNVKLKVFKGTKTDEISKRLLIASYIKIGIKTTWSDINLQNNDQLQAKFYWRNINDTAYTLLYNFGVTDSYPRSFEAHFNPPDALGEYQFKIEFIKSTNNVNKVEETVITDKITALDGPKTPNFATDFTYVKYATELKVELVD